MILRSIILNGFKSFGRKTILDISKNVTGIVGPNGSGKSNIVEAIRFVLGEQSMKNIRSKSLADLIHKGEAELSRASVSIIIDNKEKLYNENISPNIATFLVYDEITLTREIYKDGLSQYKINNTLVRLKDIQELLSLAGIGQSVHTIISQGEADSILSSSKEERKNIIADAIGLKVLENRLKESNKKLDKTDKHIETANLLRREIAPELRELKLLKEKIDNTEDIKKRLKQEYIKFFLFEYKNIESRKSKIGEEKNIESNIKDLETKLHDIKNSILKLESEAEIHNKQKQNKEDLFRSQILNKEKENSILLYEKNNLINKIRNEAKTININKHDFINFKQNILNKIDIIYKYENLSNINYNDIKKTLIEIRALINNSNRWHDEALNTELLNKDINNLDNKINIISSEISTLNDQITKIRNENNQALIYLRNLYTEDKETEIKLRDKVFKRDYIIKEMQSLKEEENNFNYNLKEAGIFLGESINNYKDYESDEYFISQMSKYSHFENRKQIEKCKIKIEEIGIIDSKSIINSYEAMAERDEHLKKEIEDLENARVKILELIEELRIKIKQEFENGLVKINELFNNYFHEIFSGGSASLVPVKIEKSINQNEDDEINDDININNNIGIDININLPSKKIKDINMLSGGEKTLLSISILFALTTLNTPPFMVLDETDAALDESNARKYGKLLQRLAKNSRLLVVTHNRETMNKSDILYGITMGNDGCSRILSIKFED